MTELIAVGAVAATASSVAAIGSWAWIRGRQGRRQFRGTQGQEYSPERYIPMLRLTIKDDLEFLRRTTCRKSGMVARWDRARRRVFRLYLQDLTNDFRCLHAEARALVSESPEQYSDLVGVLMRQQVTFWRAMAAVRVRLALSSFGIAQADVRELLGVVEDMRTQIELSIASASA